MQAAPETPLPEFAIIGLGVMGQAFAENLLGFLPALAVYDTSDVATREFCARHPKAIAAGSLDELIALMAPPRRFLVLVPAGSAVDEVLDALRARVDPGDVLVDLGNSNWKDTEQRARRFEDGKILFVGSGISGGEEGARNGPAMMPGGNPDAWPQLREVLQSASAQAEGEPCCDWVGRGGAGHFVKMVHNGIEYGDMQVIAEAYDLMHRGLGMSHGAMAHTFSEWNNGELASYLIEIAADILAKADSNGQPLVEQVLDVAGQKGTGTWTAINALELGVPVNLIAEAVFARAASARKLERVRLASVYNDSDSSGSSMKRDGVVEDLEMAILGARLVSYAQGFMLLHEASQVHGFDLNLANVARGWRGGCIIRSALLEPIARAFDADSDTAQLLGDPAIADNLRGCIAPWRRVVAGAVRAGVPVPALSAGLAFFDTLRAERVPANMVQALRDCFGAHTFERVDAPRGESFHANWREHGES